jgi:mono/diheme cytochrome c family protein
MIVVGALALVGFGVVVGIVLVVFGVIPGFGIRRASGGLAADSTAADSMAAIATPPATIDTAALTVPLAPMPGDSAALAAGGAVTAADSAAGEAIFRGEGRCLSCHGATGEGVAQLGPNLRDARWITGDGSRAAIERTVREGSLPPKEFPIAMPAYDRQLPAEGIARVAAYVFAISHPGAVRADSVAIAPDSTPVPRPTVPQ